MKEVGYVASLKINWLLGMQLNSTLNKLHRPDVFQLDLSLRWKMLLCLKTKIEGTTEVLVFNLIKG